MCLGWVLGGLNSVLNSDVQMHDLKKKMQYLPFQSASDYIIERDVSKLLEISDHEIRNIDYNLYK